MRIVVAALLFLLAAITPALAVNPDEVLSDPKLESRARMLSGTPLHGLPEPVDRRFQCRSCQGSAAAGARAAQGGRQRQQVLDYLVSRYGEFVLLKPRLSAHTVLLWGMPILLLLVGGLVLLRQALRRSRTCRRSSPYRKPSAPGWIRFSRIKPAA
jgi:cytochrome c-type biogenesis protein CcmH